MVLKPDLLQIQAYWTDTYFQTGPISLKVGITIKKKHNLLINDREVTNKKNITELKTLFFFWSHGTLTEILKTVHLCYHRRQVKCFEGKSMLVTPKFKNNDHIMIWQNSYNIIVTLIYVSAKAMEYASHTFKDPVMPSIIPLGMEKAIPLQSD